MQSEALIGIEGGPSVRTLLITGPLGPSQVCAFQVLIDEGFHEGVLTKGGFGFP